MDAKDVLGDSCEQMLAAANSKRHAELITRLKELVKGLDEGRFVASAPADAVAPGAEISAEDVGDAELLATLTDDQVEEILAPLRLAIESKSPKVIRAALAALQRLIAHGALSGDADLRDEDASATAASAPSAAASAPSSSSATATDGADADAETGADVASSDPAASSESTRLEGDPSRESTPPRKPPPASTPNVAFESTPLPPPAAPLAPLSRRERHCGEAVALICAGGEVVDERCELECLKGLLAAVSSRHFRVHGRALLRVVRTCYNVHLGSKSEVNQATAKASLTQMLTVVFHRLETDDPSTLPPPIVVADLLGKNNLATTKSGDDSFENLVGYVQGLLNKAIADTNAGITAVGVAVGAVEPDDGCVDETRGKNEVTSREFDEESEPATPKSNVSRSGSVTPRHSVGEGIRTPVSSARKTLENDAFLVFRALCKLAKKAGDLTAPAVLRGKTLSLELLKILLANAGPVFASTRRFVDATKEYVCDAVVTNAAPGVPVAYQLSLSIFLTLLEKFRAALKPEIGYFYPLLMLKPLEVVIGAPLAPYTQRQILLQCHRKLCGDAQLLVDLFVNYDCDLDSSNLFERTVNSVVRVAQGLPGVAEQTGQELARESMLATDALGCITKLLEALGGWVDDKLGVGAAADAAAKARKLAASRTDEVEDDGNEGEDESAAVGIERAKASKAEYQRAIALFNKKPKKGVALMQKIGRLGETPEEIAAFLRHTPDLDKTVIGDYLGERDEPMLSVMHAYVDAMDFTDQTLDEGIRKFLEGFRLPGESQKIDRLMEKFAERFCKQNPGEYKSADTAYVLAFSVIMLNTDAHNPQVKNKMTKEGFLRNNRGIDDGADLPKEHLENLYDRIVNNEIRMKDEDPELLAQKAEMNAKDGASSFNRTMKDMSNRLGMDVLSQMMFGATKREKMVDASGFMEEVRERAKRDNGRFQTATDPSCVRPMLDVAWPAMLAVFSMSFEVSEAPATVDAALAGFSRAIHLTCVTGMTETRDAFVLPLANLTSLHSPGALRGKNVVAMRELLKVGMDNANTLGPAWTHCLKAVSRYDRLYNYAMGFDDVSLFTDESYKGDRGGEGSSGDGGGKRGGASRLFRRSSAKVGPGGRFGSPAVVAGQGGAKAPSPSSSSSSSGLGGLSFMMPTTSMSGMFGGGGGDESPFAHLKKASVNNKTDNGAPTGVASSPSSAPPPKPEPEPPVDKFLLHDLEFEPPPKEILEALTPDDASVVFGSTDQLDSEAVIEFVRALCEVAREELGARSPRVFSLAKLVEIAVMNMSSRPRIIWSRMWSVLADFFAEVGCHSNLRIAQYVVDSLRQLAMKFLERGELANYSFQNEFLRPFVVLMRQSDAPEIRELIIRCTSQMVSGHVDNVKSGWKSMFMIFTAAANDEERAVVQLAFETIERIIRDQFEHITETDATTFTDCVNCLIAFTNSPTAPEEVCLNAIAFLRYCALKLADGSLGKLELTQLGDDAADDADGAFNTPPGSPAYRGSSRSPKKPRERERGATDFTDAELDLSYWFPLLAGLSELTFDARRDIRRSALEVLFDILKFHGDHFSPGFWARVYESILMPVFDHVRAEVCDADVQTASPFVQQSPHPPSAGKPPAHPRHKPLPRDRNAEADAWLYQTCQHCLELVVDLTAQFYPAVTQTPDILPKFLALLSGLATKDHEALAACGIGALSRLLLGAGHGFDENAWTIAVDALADAMTKTTPDVRGLVKENASGDVVSSASNGVAVEMTAEMEASVVLGTYPSAWLRASGTCACHASTQRLLVSAAAEAYFRHGRRMSAGRLETLTRALERCAAHAADVNGDAELCGRLARATAAAATAVAERPSLLEGVASRGGGSGSGATGGGGGGGAFRFLPDPPLVALEVEASQAALAVLLHLHTAGEEPAASGGTKGGGDDKSQSDAQAAAAASSRHRLAGLATRILRDFARLASDEGGGCVGAQARDEINARAPLAVDALKALARFSDDLFAEKVEEAFPALTALVRCEHAPAEVTRVLGEVFTAKIGPLVISSLGKS